MGTGFDELYSNTMTNEDFVRAMEAQGMEIVPVASTTTFTVFGPFEIVGSEVNPKPEPYFGTHIREAWASINKLFEA